MNLLQKTTKNGRPIINSATKLPEFNRSVHYRSNLIKQQLGYTNNKPSFEQRWDNIKTELSNLN